MRFQNKYKFLPSQSSNTATDIPVRVLKFSRTKWSSILSTFKNRKRVQLFIYLLSLYKKKIKINLIRTLKKVLLANANLKKFRLLKYTKRLPFNNLKFQVSFKKWERVKNVYKSSLFLKRFYFHLYDHKLAYKIIKKKLLEVPNMSYISCFQSFMQFELRLDILLWRLRFFSTSHQASIVINHGFIKVNSKVVKSNYILQPGDVVMVEDTCNFLFFLRRLKKTFLMQNFFEVDYYTNNIIILDSLISFDHFDYSLFIKQYFDLMKFYNSLKY